jgi:hypothetical protein
MNDGNVTPQDLKNLRREAQAGGWGDVALGIFQNEPVLAEAVANRWGKIREMLAGLGLSEEQATPVLQQMGRLLVEGIGAVQQSGRRLWDDLLPDMTDGKTE